MLKRTYAALCAVILCTLLIPVAAVAKGVPVELVGTLRYPDGSPAAGVTLHLGKKAVTDENGCYRVTVGLDNLRSNGATAEHGDYVLCEFVNVSDSELRNQPIVRDFTLLFACLVLGEVVDDATSQPIADAKVDIGGQYGGGTKTGSDGTFKMRVAPVAELWLEVKKNGYVTSRINFSAEDLNATAFRIKLKTGGIVRGQVTDKAGAPIQGVRVAVYEEQVHTKSATTDADGRYEIRDIRTDRPTGVSASFDSYRSAAQKLVEFPLGQNETVADFTLDRIEPRTIEGTVVDPSGKPVAGAEVSYGESTCAGNRRATKTGDGGAYKLDNVSPDKGLILVLAKGFAPAFLPVEENTRRADAKLQAAHSAEVTVLDRNRKPLAGVTMSANVQTPVLGRLYDTRHVIGSGIYRWIADRIRTDVDGKARLNDLPASGVVLDIYKKDYAAPWNTPIRVDRTDNVVTMRGMPQFAGTVIDAATGKPLRGFKVKWGTSYNQNSVFDSSDGRFKVQLDDMRFLDQKQYDVKVCAEGYVSEEKKLATTETPKVDYSAVFALTKPFPITGRVTDSAGKGIAGAKVLIVEKGGYIYYEVPPKVSDMAYQLTAVTGQDGRFSLPQARERNATIIVEKPGFCKLVRESVDLTKPLNLTLSLPASVEVKAQRIAAGVEPHVNISSRGSTRIGNVTEALSNSGVGQYTGFEPGRYSVQVWNRRHRSTRDVTLTRGSKTTVDLDTKGQVVVRGVVARGGMPVEGVDVDLLRGLYNRNQDSCETDREGRFEIEIEKPGEASMSCRIDGHWCANRNVQLKAGENVANFDLPNGRISGKVIDARTGQPLAGETVEAKAKWVGPSRRYSGEDYSRFWVGMTAASAVTQDDGAFTLNGVPSGEVVLAIMERDYRSKCVHGPMKIDENTPIEGVALRVQEKGTLAVSVVDAETGKPIPSGRLTAATSEGVLLPDPYDWNSQSQMPARSYELRIDPHDGRHLPASAKVEIKPRQTAKVRFKLHEVDQRIVFDVSKAGKFGKLNWIRPSRDQQPEGPLPSIAWIGYTLKDAATGKPILIDPLGREWTGRLERSKPNAELAIPVQPGKYVLEAVLRNAKDDRIESKSNLWHVKKTITVERGRDEVIEVR